MGIELNFGEDVRWRAPTWVWERIAPIAIADPLSAPLLEGHQRQELDLTQARPEALAALARLLKSLEQRTLNHGPAYFESVPNFGKFLARLGGLRTAINVSLALRGREEVEDTLTVSVP